MLAFLSERVVAASAKANDNVKNFPTDCNDSNTIVGYPFGEKYQLAAGDFICVDASNTAFIALGKSLEISGNGQDGRELSSSANAWGASRGWYKIRATTATEVTLYMNEKIAVPDSNEMHFEGYPNVKGTYHYILSIKDDWNGFGYSDFEAKSFDKQKPNEVEAVTQSEIIYLLNPMKSEITMVPKADANIDPTPAGGIQIDKKFTTFDELIAFQPLTNIDELVKGDVELDKKYVSRVNFAYDHDENIPAYWPDINIELRGSNIFDDNSESYKFLGHGGLTVGEIAAIVVACCIVVIIIICVIVCCICKSICGCCRCCNCCGCCSCNKQIYEDDITQRENEK